MSDNGSIWIKCNQTGHAACPHCEAISWNNGNNSNWGGGCKHVINPGTVEERDTPTGPKTIHPAIIFKGEK